jgi:predicted O-methyltransferase YrrM
VNCSELRSANLTIVNTATFSYAESFISESDITLAARERAAELGCVPIEPGGAAALTVLAAAVGARAVVEVGTGAGVSGLCLLNGMRPDGILTTVDIESDNQRAARQAFTDAGFAANRFRMINGSAVEVLPRLTDGAYDLVYVDADKSGYAVYHEQAVRLLRSGGVVVYDNMLWHDRVPDPSVRDSETMTLRELGRTIRDDKRLTSALLASGDGLLVAVKR